MTTTETNARLRRRDLDALNLSTQAREDIVELEIIRGRLVEHNAAIKELNARRLTIWKRRYKKGKGDLKINELARLSDVAGAYITKELAK